MSITRRALLKFAPAAPWAAKKAAEEISMESLTNIGQIGGYEDVHPGIIEGCVAEDSRAGELMKAARKSLVNMIDRGELPDEIMDRVRREAQQVRYVDPDIASMQSTSYVYKVHKMAKRREQAQLANMKKTILEEDAMNYFREKFGFYF